MNDCYSDLTLDEIFCKKKFSKIIEKYVVINY